MNPEISPQLVQITALAVEGAEARQEFGGYRPNGGELGGDERFFFRRFQPAR
ncbi:hypothetical protein [Planomonospora parontospora]|uniref:hypothetical protein n=1 Tax=Planomonospora parontospora TaxID=58119 RepID=UPI001670C03B|nr:hypothetical protein [Planomonospora parontospora]